MLKVDFLCRSDREINFHIVVEVILNNRCLLSWLRDVIINIYQADWEK